MFARLHGIDTFEEKQGVIGGWEGTSKGLLQALWERGLISGELLDKYTVDGRKDAITGEIDLQQFLGTQLGATVELTPKFHAELAGEGVEYS
jgi:hypothetical protein